MLCKQRGIAHHSTHWISYSRFRRFRLYDERDEFKTADKNMHNRNELKMKKKTACQTLTLTRWGSHDGNFHTTHTCTNTCVRINIAYIILRGFP